MQIFVIIEEALDEQAKVELTLDHQRVLELFEDEKAWWNKKSGRTWGRRFQRWTLDMSSGQLTMDSDWWRPDQELDRASL